MWKASLSTKTFVKNQKYRVKSKINDVHKFIVGIGLKNTIKMFWVAVYIVR